MTDSDEHVYIWADESKVHDVIKHDGQRFSSERCNLDDVRGERHESSTPPEGIPESRYCRRCFPSIFDIAEGVLV
jgi:hypothetical protein